MWKNCEKGGNRVGGGEGEEALFCYFFAVGVLLMSVDEDLCSWFYTPVSSYKFHQLTVYLHSPFTVPLTGGAIGIQSNICGRAFLGR